MGKRLSKIYTRTGDKGETGLGDGSRTNKDNSRIQSIGSVDELNSWIGLLVEQLVNSEQPGLAPSAGFLRGCQHRIFDLGGEISIPGYQIITQAHVEKLSLNWMSSISICNRWKILFYPGAPSLSLRRILLGASADAPSAIWSRFGMNPINQ